MIEKYTRSVNTIIFITLLNFIQIKSFVLWANTPQFDGFMGVKLCSLYNYGLVHLHIKFN